MSSEVSMTRPLVVNVVKGNNRSKGRASMLSSFLPKIAEKNGDFYFLTQF